MFNPNKHNNTYTFYPGLIEEGHEAYAKEFVAFYERCKAVELKYNKPSMLLAMKFLENVRVHMFLLPWSQEQGAYLIRHAFCYFSKCIKTEFGGSYKQDPTSKKWGVDVPVKNDSIEGIVFANTQWHIEEIINCYEYATHVLKLYDTLIDAGAAKVIVTLPTPEHNTNAATNNNNL